MAPCWGINILLCSSQLLPRLCLGPLKDFWADTAPFKGPPLASCVASRTTEKQGQDAVRCARLGLEVPGHWTDANLNFVSVKNILFTPMIVKSQQNRIELVTWPGIWELDLQFLKWYDIFLASLTRQRLSFKSCHEAQHENNVKPLEELLIDNVPTFCRDCPKGYVNLGQTCYRWIPQCVSVKHFAGTFSFAGSWTQKTPLRNRCRNVGRIQEVTSLFQTQPKKPNLWWIKPEFIQK